MTTNHVEQAMPLVLRCVTPTLSLAEQEKPHFGAVEEALPIAVERRRDGVLVHHDTYTTEVHTETTDDV